MMGFRLTIVEFFHNFLTTEDVSPRRNKLECSLSQEASIEREPAHFEWIRYLQTGIVIAALSRSHHCDVLVRLGCFGRGSADCPFSGQRTWDAPSNRWPLLSDKPYGADSELPCRQSF